MCRRTRSGITSRKRWGTDMETLYCDLCQKSRRVVEQQATPGFTGALIYWTELSCGHQHVDLNGDIIDNVR